MRVAIADGDVTESRAEAIVNAWNRNVIPWFLLLPGGVARAIGRKAGWRIYSELGLRPIPAGAARATGAGKLPAPTRCVIHVAGIDLLWRATERTIADATRAAIAAARARGCRSIALPVIGGGIGGKGVEGALAIMRAAIEPLPDDPPIDATIWRYP